MFTNQHPTTTVRQIYELRYTSYLGNDSINPNPDRLFRDVYDDAENCRSHIEYVDGQPAGSIRACIYDPASPHLKLPAMENFGQEIETVLGPDSKLVEANKYIIHPDFQRRMNRLKFQLYGYIFHVAKDIGADYIVGAIRPAQAAFYRRMCFVPISEVKQSLHMKFETVLMACPIHDAMRYVSLHQRQYG